jgi:hypothetical protein
MIANKLKKIEYLKFPSLEGRRGGSINKNIQFFEFHRLYGQTLIKSFLIYRPEPIAVKGLLRHIFSTILVMK